MRKNLFMFMKKKHFQSFKWALLTCSVVIFMSCSNADERKNFGLKGNVKNYFERLYEVEKKFGKWEMGSMASYGHNRVTFDENGLYQEFEYYIYDMDLIGKLIPIRENGKVLEEIYYDENGYPKSKTTIKHISKNEVDFESFDSEGKKNSYGKTIRKNGNIINQFSTTIRSNVEDEKYTTLFEYDKDGNLISRKQTNQKGEIVVHLRFEYLEFDEKKNWTKRLIYEKDDKPENIAIREIEYY